MGSSRYSGLAMGLILDKNNIKDLIGRTIVRSGDNDRGVVVGVDLSSRKILYESKKHIGDKWYNLDIITVDFTSFTNINVDICAGICAVEDIRDII